MNNHAKHVTLNAQSNASSWHARAQWHIAQHEHRQAIAAQNRAAYWNGLALSHLNATE